MNSLLSDIIQEFPKDFDKELEEQVKWLTAYNRSDVIRAARIALNKTIMNALIDDLATVNKTIQETRKETADGRKDR